MPAVNPDLPRWTFASVADYLKTALAVAPALANAIDGLDDRSQAFMELVTRAEISINGPSVKEESKGRHRVFVDVNVVIGSIQGLGKNAYDHIDAVGKVVSALDATIPVKNHGDADPAETLFCLVLRNAANDSILVQNVELDTTDRRRHTVIDARYVGYFIV